MSCGPHPRSNPREEGSMAEQLNCEGEDMDCRLNLNNCRSLKSGTLSMILVPMHVLNLYDIPNIGGNSQGGWGCEVAVVRKYERPHGFRMAGWLTAVLKLLRSWNSTSSMSYLELAKRASIRWCREKCHPKISGMLLEELPKSVTPGHWNIQTCTAWDVLGCLEASVFQYPMERGKNRTSKIDKHTQARAHSML